MSDNFCPKCNSKIRESVKFCPQCGFSLSNEKTRDDEIKNNFNNIKEDISSKIHEKLENEDLFKTIDIKEMIKNLDDNSLNQLLEKYGISQSKLKLMDLKKLFDQVDLAKLKEDLIEFGIPNSKFNSNHKSTRTTIIIEDENGYSESQEVTSTFVEDKEPQINEIPEHTRVNESPNIKVCSKCGFENRSKVKFCTNCGNKL